MLERTLKLEELARILPPPKKALSVEEIDEAIVRAAVKRATRSPVKGLDTNVVLRLLLEDIGRRLPGRARRCGARRGKMLGQPHRARRSDLASSKRSPLPAQAGRGRGRGAPVSDDLLIEDRDVVRSALYAFRTSRADFAECLLGMSDGLHGCERTLTFDRRAAELDEFELV